MEIINTQKKTWYKIIFIYTKDIFLDLFMSLGPSLNYLFQAKKFNKTKSSKGFSNFLCLVTILSHTLKVFFWLGKKFKYTLLIQSLLVIFTQLYLIYLVIKYKYENISQDLIYKNNKKEKIKCENLYNWSNTFNRKLIWRWNNVIEYYKFYFFIIFILSVFSLILGIKNKYYINIIGTLSVFLEMLCSLPQIIEMQKSKNQRNISKINCILIYQIFYYYIKNEREGINNYNYKELQFVNEEDNSKKKIIEELKINT